MSQKKIRKPSRKSLIKQDLLDQLERNQTYGAYYTDLVEDYMNLWDIKNKLVKDIRKRGVAVEYIHGQNQRGWKKNDSIAELNKTNAQMLKILKELGIKPGDMLRDDSDDEEM